VGNNADQIAFWNGPAADGWTAAQERLDRLLAPLSDAALAVAAVAPGERVLDVGCGCGATSLQIAASAGDVLGVDVSAPMLARARDRAAAYGNVEFLLADASEHALGPGFDLLFSRFGVMFFADPVAAFRNLHRALSPTGRLCFVCWQAPSNNPWMAVAARAAQAFLPDAERPDPRSPGPFAFAEADYVREILNAAGFAGVEVTPLHAELELGASVDEAVEFLGEVGPLRRVLDELEGEPRDRAMQAARQALAAEAGSRDRPEAPFTLGAAAWIVTAQRG
jgi:SAM-dependent methyltransferase